MDTRIWDDVVALHARVEVELTATLRKRHGIGLSEFRALAALAGADDGELRMQDLAELVGLNQSSVTRLVGRLEADGLSKRDLCPDDRRGVYTVITEQGRARHREAAPSYRAALRKALDEAGGDRRLGGLVRRLRE